MTPTVTHVARDEETLIILGILTADTRNVARFCARFFLDQGIIQRCSFVAILLFLLQFTRLQQRILVLAVTQEAFQGMPLDRVDRHPVYPAIIQAVNLIKCPTRMVSEGKHCDAPPFQQVPRSKMWTARNFAPHLVHLRTMKQIVK